jgi:integrase
MASLALAATVPASDRHPVAVYLARLAPGSRRAMRQALEAIAEVLAPGAGAMALPWHLLRYQHTQAVRARLAARYAPATVNKALCALRGVLTEAWRLGLLGAEDHARAADLASVRGARLLRGRALTPGEVRALFDHAGPRDAALLAVLYGCGLRRAEVVALDLAHVDRAGGALRVLGKGNKERAVPMPPGTARALEAWLAVRGGEAGPLFWSCDRGHLGDRLTAAGVLVALQRLARRAGVAAFSPHDLRRSYVGDLLDAGVDLATVQALAGHASVQTTARYDRRGDRAKARAAATLHVPFVG